MPSPQRLRYFFRFITSDNTNQIKIPKKFTRQYRNEILANKVHLRVPGDKPWPVWPVDCMVTGDGNIWFKNGWREFYDHYGLKFGHLLYFIYHRKSFYVQILDPNYSERFIKLENIQENEETEVAHESSTCQEPQDAMPSPRRLTYFFRFINSDNTNQIKIPKKFTRHYRNQILLNNFVLLGSDDKSWSVGCTVTGNGHIWFQTGWRKFYDHYGLKFGHLLYFNHNGQSTFDVQIFDPNYSERFIKPNNIQEDEDMLLQETECFQETSTCQESQVNADLAKKQGKKQRSRNRGYESAKSSKPKKPHYSITIRDSYLKSRFYVPVGFCRRYLLCDGKSGSCVLKMSNGRKWGPVDCRAYEGFGRLYGKNLKKFCYENKLKVGDVCVFELIDRAEKVMKVTISRAC